MSPAATALPSTADPMTRRSPAAPFLSRMHIAQTITHSESPEKIILNMLYLLVIEMRGRSCVWEWKQHVQ